MRAWKPFDFLVVGAGLYGSVFARSAAERGRRCLVIDQRPHIGGNCYSERIAGIHVHQYGPHTFHTNDAAVWRWVNRFARFNHFRLHPKVSYRGRIFSFPINLLTMQQVFGIASPEEARQKLDAVRIACANPRNLEDWALAQLGPELYEIFIHGYTTKQWGRDPRDLPPSILRRIPIRLTYNDRHHDDRFEGVPIGGYTRMFENMLDHDNIEVELGVNYFGNRRALEGIAGRVVYTGKIDEYFDYRFGELEYRSLRFEHEIRAGDFQGCVQVNYTEREVPWTRIVEHKHFEFLTTPNTVITREYPLAHAEGNLPFYPIRDEPNTDHFARYWQEATAVPNVLFGGRLARYQYLDMHMVVAQALADYKRWDKMPGKRGRRQATFLASKKDGRPNSPLPRPATSASLAKPVSAGERGRG